MPFAVVGEAEERSVVLVDVAAAFGDVGRAGLAADFQAGGNGTRAGAFLYGLDEDLLHPFGRRGREDLPVRRFVERVGLPADRVDPLSDGGGGDGDAAVVEDVVGLHQLHQVDLQAVAVGGGRFVNLGIELADSGDVAGFLIGQLHARRLRQAEVAQPFGELVAVELLGQLRHPDVRRVDDDVLRAEPVELVFVGDDLAAHAEAPPVAVDDVVGVDFAVFEQDGEDERFEHGTRFETVLKGPGIERAVIAFLDAGRVEAVGTGQGKDLAGAAVHDDGHDLVGKQVIFHRVDDLFHPDLQRNGDGQLQVVAVQRRGVEALFGQAFVVVDVARSVGIAVAAGLQGGIELLFEPFDAAVTGVSPLFKLARVADERGEKLPVGVVSGFAAFDDGEAPQERPAGGDLVFDEDPEPLQFEGQTFEILGPFGGDVVAEHDAAAFFVQALADLRRADAAVDGEKLYEELFFARVDVAGVDGRFVELAGRRDVEPVRTDDAAAHRLDAAGGVEPGGVPLPDGPVAHDDGEDGKPESDQQKKDDDFLGFALRRFSHVPSVFGVRFHSCDYSVLRLKGGLVYSKSMIVRMFTLVLLLFLGVSRAELLETGRVYTGPLKLTALNLGASMMLPEGWEGQLVADAGPLVLQSRTDASRILMEANVSITGDPTAMLGEKKEYYGLELFSPTQIKRMRPSLFYRLYQVKGSDTFSQALVYLVVGTQERAVVLYGFFTPGGYDTMRQTMMTFSDSLGFTAMRALPEQMTQLYLQLEDGHFVFYARRGSFSEKREVWLCRSGDAVLKGIYTVANNTSRSVTVRRGKWSMQDDRLVLEFTDGVSERYRVTKEENTLFFDGAQTFRLPNHGCGQ